MTRGRSKRLLVYNIEKLPELLFNDEENDEDVMNDIQAVIERFEKDENKFEKEHKNLRNLISKYGASIIVQRPMK